MFRQLSTQLVVFVNSPARRAAVRLVLFAFLVLASLLFPHNHAIHQLADGRLIGGGQPT